MIRIARPLEPVVFPDGQVVSLEGFSGVSERLIAVAQEMTTQGYSTPSSCRILTRPTPAAADDLWEFTSVRLKIK